MAFVPDILQEDNHLLVVRKPAGMLTQGDETGDLDLLSALKEYLRMRDAKPGNAFLGMVHRLDRPVGGAMVFAKTSKAAARLSRAFAQREVKKTYLAAVEGAVKDAQAELRHSLLWNEQERRSTVALCGKEALLRFDREQVDGQRRMSLLRVLLITGMHHQIRAQLAAVGHPVVGDRKYGAKAHIRNHPGVIALHAVTIAFPHPTKGDSIVVDCPPEAWWPFRAVTVENGPGR